MDNKDNKAGKLIFEINNGGEQTWNQSVRDGSVIIESRHGDEVTKLTIPAGDMVMLANYYRYIKETDENISFVDYVGGGVKPYFVNPHNNLERVLALDEFSKKLEATQKDIQALLDFLKK